MKSVEWLLAKADKAYECGEPFKAQGDRLKQEAFEREIMIEKIRAGNEDIELCLQQINFHLKAAIMMIEG